MATAACLSRSTSFTTRTERTSVYPTVGERLVELNHFAPGSLSFQRTVLPNEKVTKDPFSFSLRNNILSLKYNQQFLFRIIF